MGMDQALDLNQEDYEIDENNETNEMILKVSFVSLFSSIS